MCGFAGVFSRDLSREILYEIVDKMSDSLTHRGPDDRGNWTDYNLGLSISHQRFYLVVYVFHQSYQHNLHSHWT